MPLATSRSNVVALALALGAASLAASLATATPAFAECKVVKTDELDVRFVGNRPLVEATINGKPVWLEVDTGAYASTLFGPAAVKLGLKMYDTGDRAVGVGGEVEVMRATLDEFALQKTKVKNFRINVTGGINVNARVSRNDEREVVGLLGRDFLGLVDLEFDLANNKIRLFQTHDCGKRSLAYWTDAPGYVDMERNYPVSPFDFPLKLNGYFVRAILDSGAGYTVVTPSVAAHAGVSEDQFSAKSSRSSGIGNRTVETHTATFNEVDLGDEKIPHAQLSVSELFRSSDDWESTGNRAVKVDRTEMLLGADFMHAHRLFIANSQNRIYFTYNGGPIFHKVTTDRPPSPSTQPVPAPPQP